MLPGDEPYVLFLAPPSGHNFIIEVFHNVIVYCRMNRTDLDEPMTFPRGATFSPTYSRV